MDEQELCTFADSQCTKTVISFCHFLLLATSHMGYIGTIILSFWTLQFEFRLFFSSALISYTKYLKESLFSTNSDAIFANPIYRLEHQICNFTITTFFPSQVIIQWKILTHFGVETGHHNIKNIIQPHHV